ncbi:glutaredoxin family protein [Arthrobacter sulfonylureivorans]|uniref:Glutaredoxin family protein n=1 Tax=Arthrobacter sulfonylureivorans TaxID=2486855 RepID=A0ABY3WE39_9MICC|nr:glutaredoxin family protein [Arthrobacter sulfonylureivorans]UNK46592.1 glutaredoxin family protein [Arthrobacter sulfonylureivorans]
MNGSEDRSHELVLLTKPGCHLCQAARETVERVAGELGVPWEEKNILEDPELERRFAEEIPVVMIDGVQRDFWHIDPERLRRLLTQ